MFVVSVWYGLLDYKSGYKFFVGLLQKLKNFMQQLTRLWWYFYLADWFVGVDKKYADNASAKIENFTQQKKDSCICLHLFSHSIDMVALFLTSDVGRVQ